MTPKDRKYTATHEWVKITGDTATIGITDHAQEALGDITFVELPSVGKSVKKDGSAAVIESVKAASDIYSPVSGEIVEVNKALEKTPELINQSAYETGWIFRVKLSDPAASTGLLDSKQYEDGLKE